MARLANEGHEVRRSAILAEGIAPVTSNGIRRNRKRLNDLHSHAQLAADKVRAKELVLCKLPDNRMDTVPLLEVVKVVEELLERFRPSVIYTHHSGDLNADHGVVHRAVLTATRPVPGQRAREIYAFEVPSSTEWAFHAPGADVPAERVRGYQCNARTPRSRPSHVMKRETELFPHPRSPEALRAIAMRWGSVAGFQAAEAFELIRSLRPAIT